MYFAHSTGDQNRSDWQPLAAHLRDVAALAGQFGAELGLAKAARLAGLLHDLGKYSPRFQARLHGGKEPVDHSTAGAAIACARATGDDRVIAELVARGGVDRNLRGDCTFVAIPGRPSRGGVDRNIRVSMVGSGAGGSPFTWRRGSKHSKHETVAKRSLPLLMGRGSKQCRRARRELVGASPPHRRGGGE